MLRGYQTDARKLLKNFGEQRGRNAVNLGDVTRALSLFNSPRREVLYRDQTVIGLFG